MKIALIAPAEETVPPRKYGGTEWIVYYIAHYMGEKGHDVDLYAAGDSNQQPYYNLIPTVSQSLRSHADFVTDLKKRETAKWMSIAETLKLLRKRKYDIIHNHASWRFLSFAPLINQPIVTTHHGPLNLGYQNLVFLKYKQYPYVSISNNQRKDLPELNFVATVYNGTDTDMFPYFEQASMDDHKHMIFLARMSQEKGAVEAAQAAIKTGHELVLGTKIDTVDESYYAGFKPLVDNKKISIIGEMDHDQRLEFLNKARLLIAPIKWEEPFGLMFTEAMSCGTPVVAFARGAAPEIIVDGVTGYLVNQSDKFKRGDWIVKKTGVDGLCEAIEKIYAIPDDQYWAMRKACRKHVEDHFSIEKMANAYEQVYTKLI